MNTRNRKLWEGNIDENKGNLDLAMGIYITQMYVYVQQEMYKNVHSIIHNSLNWNSLTEWIYLSNMVDKYMDD